MYKETSRVRGQVTGTCRECSLKRSTRAADLALLLRREALDSFDYHHLLCRQGSRQTRRQVHPCSLHERLPARRPLARDPAWTSNENDPHTTSLFVEQRSEKFLLSMSHCEPRDDERLVLSKFLDRDNRNDGRSLDETLDVSHD